MPIDTRPPAERCLVLQPRLRYAPKDKAATSLRMPEHALEEAAGLAAAIDLEVCEGSIVPVARVKPGAYFGSGKIEELASVIAGLDATLVIVNTALSPIQQRNLETAWKVKVIDRTALILEIFGRRAATREGQLQVELAALTYQKSRLVRSWTHLERQRGGHGFLGGPGESQLETDRRILNDRIAKLRRQLEKVRKTRALHRKKRDRVPYPVVALVGYTNAGKSTLFNRLTGAEVVAEDMLFATLDPTMRAVRLPAAAQVILSDTVGFISDLPTDLVAAFRATLEEVERADVILHVRDIAHPDTEAQRADVRQVLAELGVPEDAEHILEVRNKIDLLPETEKGVHTPTSPNKGAVSVSAVTGEGVEALLRRVEAMV